MAVVSIIVPFFNRFELFTFTFQSILKQTFNEFEVIIVDDGSSQDEINNTLQLISEDKRFSLVKHGKGNKGPSYCRNFGVELCSGDFIMFLDSDDFITENCLKSRVEYLRNNSEIDFAVFSQHTFYHTIGDSKAEFSTYLPNTDNYLSLFLRDTPPWCVSGPLWKKNCIQQIDGFDIGLRMMEDPEFHIRAILSNLRFTVVNGQPDFYYRIPLKATASFYEKSIEGRFHFFPSVYQYLFVGGQIEKYKSDLRIGVINFLKNFLLYRVKDHKAGFRTFMQWANSIKLLNWYDIIIINLVSRKNLGLCLYRYVPATFLLKNLK